MVLRAGPVRISWGFVAWMAAFGVVEGRESGGSIVQVAQGFQVCDRLEFAADEVVGGMAYVPGGDLVLYAGGELLRRGSESAPPLATFDPSVFGAFVKLAPGGETVIFGESSAGNIYSVSLASGERVLIDNIPFCYDLAFDAAGKGFVSTTLSFGGEERIVLLDGDPKAASRPVIVGIPGFSGPMTIDGDGNLYYGTAILAAEQDSQSLFRFRREQLEAAIASGPISFSDGEEVLTEVGGFSFMLWRGGKIYFTDLGFSSSLGVGSLQVIDIEAGFAVSVLATFPAAGAFTSPTYLDLRPGARDFSPGAGAAGGSLAVAYSDFATINKVAEIAPELYFVRGEVNADGEVNITDGIALLNFLFLGGKAPDSLEAADINAASGIDIADAVYLFNFLYLGGPTIPPPYPEPGPAG